MARRAARDGGRATVEKLYPKENEQTIKRLTEKLKTYSSDQKPTPSNSYMKQVFRVDGLIVEGRAKESGSNIRQLSFPSKGHCFLRNLLELDSLVGGNKETIDVLWNRDAESRAKQRTLLTRRFRELRYLGEKYTSYADNAERLIEQILGSKDPVSEDLFRLDRSFAMKTPSGDEEASSAQEQRASFIGLTPLERIDRIGRNERLTDAEKDAEKAVTYLEMGNAALAIEFANKALSADPKNGFAWMVKGYLSLKGVEEAMLSCLVQQELGARENPITAEEQWRQQLLEEDEGLGEKKLQESVDFFLKAWVWWPNNASGFIFDSYTYKQRLMEAFFKYAVCTKFDKELFKQALRSERSDLESLCLMHVDLFLTAILPVTCSVDEKAATDLAKHFVRCVKKAKPVIGDLIPQESWENSLVRAVGKNLGHLHILSLVLPFEEVEGIMQNASRRFGDLEAVLRLKDWSNFYLKSTLGLRASEAVECSLSALRNIPFDWGHEYGSRLKRQWQYFHLRCVVQSAIESMLYKGSGKPEKVAVMLSKALSPELLEQVADKDHLIRVEKYDEVSDFTSEEDLGGRVHHVLHDGVAAVLGEFINPIIAEKWFEELVAKWEPTFNRMCRRELLLLYLDGLLSGTVTLGYQDYLRSRERNGREVYDEVYAMGEPEFKALEGHTATSFVLAYALKAAGVEEEVTRKLEGMKAVCEKIVMVVGKQKKTTK